MTWILNVLQTPPELKGLTRDYISIIFAGILFVFLYNFFSYLLRALGNSMVPLMFLAISSGMNIVLDIWFVVGLKLGVGGAALATVIAQAVSGIGIMVFSLYKLPVLRFHKTDLKWNPNRPINRTVTGMFTKET